MNDEVGDLYEDELFEDEPEEVDGYEQEEDEGPDDLFSEESDEDLYEDEDEDAFEQFLRYSRGVDPYSIKFEDENGQEVELTWNDLSKEEQLAILNDDPRNYEVPTPAPDYGLDDLEINLINTIRQSRLTPQEFMLASIQLGISQYALAPAVQYRVDSLGDDELYLADLASRLPEDTTDEELLEALEAAKANESLYAKLVAGLRAEYKQYEDSQIEQEQQLAQQQSQEQFSMFSNNVINAIEGMNTDQNALNVQLEREDMEELAEFILGQDAAGINHFSKALNDPNVLVQMAWWALHGNDTMDSIAAYYEQLMKTVAKNQYLRGLADGASRQKPSDVVVDRKPEGKRVEKQYRSIEDLY